MNRNPMTTNQLMLLLAVYRGFSVDKIACGTTPDDAWYLLRRKLIEVVRDPRGEPEWETTDKGSALVRSILDFGSGASPFEHPPEGG